MIEEPGPLTVRRSWPRPTPEQVAAFRDVPTGFVADALTFGGVLDPSIRPLGDGRDLPVTACGPALTTENGPGDLMATAAALNFVQPGDVLVVTCSGHQGCATAGDRIIGMLRNGGGAAFVSDGPVRDYTGLIAVGLPVWCTGLTPASPFTTGPGRVGLPIQIGGQRVESGDMIVADRDGVVVVPFARIDEIISALGKIRSLEEELDAKVAAGQTVSPKFIEVLEDGRTTYVD